MNKRTILIFTIILLAAGSFLKIYYIHYTETWVRQHDVISFGADEGHAYYIEYLYENKSLPDFDPRQKWGLFQPPLHHIISAAVLGISKALGAGTKRSQENIQVLTCLYMILLSVIAVKIYYKIYRENGLHNIISAPGAAVVALIVAFHPIYILLSGSINNDALSLILSVASIYIASIWYEKPTYFYTVLLALTIGLAMFAKLTGGLVAVPVGILMILRCFNIEDVPTAEKNDNTGNFAVQNHTEKHSSDFAARISFFVKNYLAKICVFSVIVFPIGLYWSIRNKLKWDMPFNYIPPVGEIFPEGTTFLSRIFDIRTKSVYPYLISSGNEYDEFNTPLLMLKSSLFGEYNYSEYGRLINFSSKVLFITAILLIILCLYATFKMTFSREGILSLKWKILLFGTYITYVLAYLYFVFSSNNFSAGDFRYAAIAVMAEGVYLGLYTDSVRSNKVKLGITMLAVLFAGSSFVTYVMLGLRS